MKNRNKLKLKKTPKEFAWVDEWAEELMGKWSMKEKK